jgi:hypothetical protein
VVRTRRSRLLHPLGIPLLALALTSCAAPPSPTPPPLASRLAVPPGLEETAAAWLEAYSEAYGPPDFDLEVLQEEAALEESRAGEVVAMLTVLEPPEGWFAAPVAEDAIAVVVHPSNSVRSYRLQDLADLFSGRVRSWEALGGASAAVQPVVPLPGDSLRLRFEGMAMPGSPVSSSALLAPDPAAVLSLVAEDAGAIGYLPLSQVTEEIRVARIDGILPGASTIADGRYPLRLTVLATAPQEPSGQVRDWIGWLQQQ